MPAMRPAVGEASARGPLSALHAMKAGMPMAHQTTPYPARKTVTGATAPRVAARAYSRTTGRTAGNIMAAIIATQAPRNAAADMLAMPIPMSSRTDMPSAKCTDNHQPRAATASSAGDDQRSTLPVTLEAVSAGPTGHPDRPDHHDRSSRSTLRFSPRSPSCNEWPGAGDRSVQACGRVPGSVAMTRLEPPVTIKRTDPQ